VVYYEEMESHLGVCYPDPDCDPLTFEEFQSVYRKGTCVVCVSVCLSVCLSVFCTCTFVRVCVCVCVCGAG